MTRANALPEGAHTHASLAKALGLTVTTIKSYRRKFPEFWRVASRGKPIRFPAESLALCRAIHRHFQRGLSVEEARARLSLEFESAALPEGRRPDRMPTSDPGHPREPVRTVGTPAAYAPASPSGSGETPGASLSPESRTGPDTAAVPGAACARTTIPPGTPGNPEALARLETLMEGLFGLQNRTHSLLAELLAKLDTLADRLGSVPATPGLGKAVAPEANQSAFKDPPPGQTPSGAAPGLQPPRAGASDPAPGRPGAPSAVRVEGLRPPETLLALPVVVRSSGGDFLGVSGRDARPCTLERFEAFLLRRAGHMGLAQVSWSHGGGEWTLELVSQGQRHEHHFQRAVTPRGNEVARFASLSVNGRPASEAALQAFLRQVKESLPQ